jgi:hypothetical protein
VITYSRGGETVRLEMDVYDFRRLLLLLGTGAGLAARVGDRDGFHRFLSFADDVNRTNPDYRPYLVVPEVQEPTDIRESKP